jgi:type IV pilus assembly protein PilM
MAAGNHILTLSLGMQTVGMAEFSPTAAGGLVLSNFKQTELMADPSADATRSAQIKIVVSEMLHSLGIRGGNVNYSVPAQAVFTRFVKLPPVDLDKVEQMVSFEAQQNVPFPIDEVVWDHQLISSARDRLEVALVAIKADLLEEMNSAVEESGLTTRIVDVAPMALYNAFRYSYSNLEGCSLLVDIGARTTNLLFSEQGKVFSRSIPIGGSTITAGVAKDFEEPFGAAETRKRQVGFVSLGGSYAEPSDPDVSRVSKIIRNTMTRLHSEIARSITFYRSQQQGSAPLRVFLCGGASGLPYMREFFTEKLQTPVEFFNPLRNVQVSQNVDVESAARHAHMMGELVGLGIRSVGNCPIELNLEPESVAQRRELAAKRPLILLAGVCALLILAGWWLYFLRAASVESAVLDSLNPKVGELQANESKFKSARGEISKQQDIAAPLLKAIEGRQFWARLIDDINQRLPARFIWITSLEPADLSVTSAGEREPSARGPETPKGHNGLRIRGLYLDNPEQAVVVDKFLANLAESPFFEIDLNKKAEFQPVRATPTTTEWAYEYELRLPFKKGVTLP